MIQQGNSYSDSGSSQKELLSVGFHAKIYPPLVSVKDLLARAQAYFGRSADYSKKPEPIGSFSKMSLDFCRLTEERILEPSLLHWQSAGMGSHTGFLTLNTSAFPSDANESSLSGVLETTAQKQHKYWISKQACRGILQRTTPRGTTIPEGFRYALVRQSQKSAE